jgi:hypothetical protein
MADQAAESAAYMPVSPAPMMIDLCVVFLSPLLAPRGHVVQEKPVSAGHRASAAALQSPRKPTVVPLGLPHLVRLRLPEDLQFLATRFAEVTYGMNMLFDPFVPHLL